MHRHRVGGLKSLNPHKTRFFIMYHFSALVQISEPLTERPLFERVRGQDREIGGGWGGVVGGVRIP